MLHMPHLNRRKLMLVAGAGSFAALSNSTASPASPTGCPELGSITDVNVTLSRWPFRRLPLDETAALAEALRQRGVTQAWAGAFDGVFHKDIRGANARLAADCRTAGRDLLLPIGSLNPRLPDWREDLRQCADGHDMPGVRLHPNYHGYRLDDPVFAELMNAAAQHRLIVQIAVHLEDERMMSSLGKAPPVDVAPLADLASRWPQTPIVLLNAFGPVRRDLLVRLFAIPNVFADMATLEGVGALETLLTEAAPQKILFGSHSPLFTFEAAALKFVESSCGAMPTAAILRKNAARLLSDRGNQS